VTGVTAAHQVADLAGDLGSALPIRCLWSGDPWSLTPMVTQPCGRFLGGSLVAAVRQAHPLRNKQRFSELPPGWSAKSGFCGDARGVNMVYGYKPTILLARAM
jgi:hypothetical protein